MLSIETKKVNELLVNVSQWKLSTFIPLKSQHHLGRRNYL